jgi:dolichyl-phosphate-mannose-protein mannosyltransferase
MASSVSHPARVAVALALASFVLYNVNVREISSQDTVPNRVLPYEVIVHGRLDLDWWFREWPADAPLPFWIQRIGPHFRSSYPLAPALLAIPVYAAPALLGAGNSWVVLNALSKLTSALLAALSVAFVYLAARELCRRERIGEGAALATAAVYAVATPTWAVTSQGLWGHAPAQLGLAVSLWALLRHEGTRGRLVVAGVAAGVMVASRPSAGLVAMVIAAYAVLSRGRAGLFCAGALGAVLAIVAAHNLAVFGSLQGGYAELHRTHAEHHGVASAWGGSIGAGLAGALVSPSRGLFVYAPVLLFPVAGLAVWLVRRRGGVLTCAALATAVGVGTIAQFSVWWGGHSFGPRLLVDVLPAMVLGLVPVWPTIRRRPVTRGLFVVAFAVSVLVEVVGAFYFPSPRAVDWDTSPQDVDFAHGRLWDWRDPQLLRLVRNGPASAGFRPTP